MAKNSPFFLAVLVLVLQAASALVRFPSHRARLSNRPGRVLERYSYVGATPPGFIKQNPLDDLSKIPFDSLTVCNSLFYLSWKSYPIILISNILCRGVRAGLPP